MLTARTEAKLKISALKVGVNDFLTKTFEDEFSNLSNLSIAVGFSDLASLSRSFKTRFGKSSSSFMAWSPIVYRTVAEFQLFGNDGNC